MVCVAWLQMRMTDINHPRCLGKSVLGLQEGVLERLLDWETQQRKPHGLSSWGGFITPRPELCFWGWRIDEPEVHHIDCQSWGLRPVFPSHVPAFSSPPGPPPGAPASPWGAFLPSHPFHPPGASSLRLDVSLLQLLSTGDPKVNNTVSAIRGASGGASETGRAEALLSQWGVHERKSELCLRGYLGLVPASRAEG